VGWLWQAGLYFRASSGWLEVGDGGGGVGGGVTGSSRRDVKPRAQMSTKRGTKNLQACLFFEFC